MLYDADRIVEAASLPDEQLVEDQRSVIPDPFDPDVIRAARANGISDLKIEYAQRSPIYEFLQLWKIALPRRPDFRTLPILFYVPPLQTVQATKRNGTYEILGSGEEGLTPMLSALEVAGYRCGIWRVCSPLGTRKSSAS